MTIAFDLALSPQLSPRLPVAAAAPLARPDAAVDFATLMADRALLSAPASVPTMAGDPALLARRAMSAPVALRFDEGPLFGRAVLQESPSTDAASGVAAGAGGFVPGAPVRLEPADRKAVVPLPRRSSSASASPLCGSQAAHGATPVGAEERMDTLAMNEIAQPATGLHGWEDIPALARSTSPAARDRTTPGGTPLQTSPQIALGGRLAAPRGSAHRPISPDRGQDKGAAGETSRELRARFVDHLGPVQVTLRQDGAALHLTARVALASAPAASLLERRLREVVSQEGHALSRLQINGQVRPAEAGA